MRYILPQSFVWERTSTALMTDGNWLPICQLEKARSGDDASWLLTVSDRLTLFAPNDASKSSGSWKWLILTFLTAGYRCYATLSYFSVSHICWFRAPFVSPLLSKGLISLMHHCPCPPTRDQDGRLYCLVWYCMTHIHTFSRTNRWLPTDWWTFL